MKLLIDEKEIKDFNELGEYFYKFANGSLGREIGSVGEFIQSISEERTMIFEKIYSQNGNGLIDFKKLDINNYTILDDKLIKTENNIGVEVCELKNFLVIRLEYEI
jgi:hypothetical protein